MSRNGQTQFMKYVQAHERRWGEKMHKGRPSLVELLKAPVVVFWKSGDEKQKSFTASVHDDLSEIEDYFVRSMIRGSIGAEVKHIAKIFRNQKRMSIRGVSVNFVEVEE
jgi:hypothetical protein